VRVKGSGERTWSEIDGQYLLTNLESGRRTLSASAEGFVSADQSVDLAAAGDSAAIDFELERRD
jgi:hypothetical protein